jgi:hypothetical protein
MKKPLKRSVLLTSLLGLLVVDLSPQAPLGVVLVKEAEAWIGRPLTPFSYAGVARRTTRRVVWADSAAMTTAAAVTTSAATSYSAGSTGGGGGGGGSVPIGTVVQSLPSGCAPTTIDGVRYYNCAPGVYYRAAFQGDNLVYVSTQP